ncbi:MAG: hypothetical protein AAFY88_19385, partial [Acidobacteriota bacterium]
MHIKTLLRRARRAGLLLLLLTSIPTAVIAAPTLVEISPPGGAVIDQSTVTLEGRAEGAVRLVVDGRGFRVGPDGEFSAGPFKLDDGDRRFVVVLEDADGEQTAFVHGLSVDTRPPTLTVARIAEVVGDPSLTVSGSVVDPHLREVRVGGRAAEVVGGQFSATVTLKPGGQRLEVVAVDVLGHESRAEVAVELDVEPPSIAN